MQSRSLGVALLVGYLLVALPIKFASSAPAFGDKNYNALPHWIGPANARSTDWTAERTFPLPAGVQSASLRFAADFCTAEVSMNNRPVLSIEAYCPTQVVDVTPSVREGSNQVRIRVTGGAPPHGVALSLKFTVASGTTVAEPVVTDHHWTCDDRRANEGIDLPLAVSRGRVQPELWGVGRRDASVSPLENYEQWRQSTADGKGPTQKLYAPLGFEVSLVRTAAADEGSWISFTFDKEGRALISREDQGFLRLTFDEERKSVTRSEPIASELREVRGLLYRNDRYDAEDRGDRYFADANNSKGLYSFRVTEDDHVVDQKLLREFPGEVGHGRNDIAFGRDFALYAIFGDSVQPPGNPIIDRTSPLREARRPVAKGDKPPKNGYVVRTDYVDNDRKWEVWCAGLRNPYGIAAHPNGDLFTYDADNEFDMGTPWYRPTRIVQLQRGGDYGYHAAVDKRRPNFVDQPDNALPTIDVGRGSPTAVMFGDGLKFPQPYRDALFALDWTYGRVLAVHLAPRGGGYRASLETFLQGRPLNVTDVAAGPDGAMYLITGGRKTQSALYRVAFTGESDKDRDPTRHERESADFSYLSRRIRWLYENMRGEPDVLLDDQSELESEDPTLRYAARLSLERLPSQVWLDDADNHRSSEYLMSIARTGDACSRANLVRRILDEDNPFDSKPTSLRNYFARSYVVERMVEAAPDSIKEHLKSIITKLVTAWPEPSRDGLIVSQYGTNHELRRRLVFLLAKLEAPQAVDLAAKSLLVSPVQEDKLAALSALSTLKTGWTPETRRLYFTALRDGRRFVGGQGMAGFLDQIRSDAVATLTDEEQKSLADLLAPPKEEDEPLPPPRAVVKQWTLDELAKRAVAEDAQGDPKRGAEIFRAALCSRCHRAGANGPSVGPDLSFVAARFSRRDILHSILTPAAAVAEQYRNSEIITADGRTLTGRVVAEGDYRSEKLLINIDPLRPSKVVEIDKKEIAEHRLLGTSPMPAGLLDGFTAAEVRDLLAFLEKPQTHSQP